MAHPTQDATSPDDTNPVLRDIHNQCAVIPVEVPGVVGVTANGNLQLKSPLDRRGIRNGRASEGAARPAEARPR